MRWRVLKLFYPDRIVITVNLIISIGPRLLCFLLMELRVILLEKPGGRTPHLVLKKLINVLLQPILSRTPRAIRPLSILWACFPQRRIRMLRQLSFHTHLRIMIRRLRCKVLPLPEDGFRFPMTSQSLSVAPERYLMFSPASQPLQPTPASPHRHLL